MYTVHSTQSPEHAHAAKKSPRTEPEQKKSELTGFVAGPAVGSPVAGLPVGDPPVGAAVATGGAAAGSPAEPTAPPGTYAPTYSVADPNAAASSDAT